MPVIVPGEVTAVVVLSLHSSWLPTAATLGVGLTVMVNVMAAPVQDTDPPVKVGVTVMVAVMAAPVALVAVNAGMLVPLPLAAKPIAVLLLVQLYTVPATEPVRLIGPAVKPLQNTWLATAFALGVGFTVMVNVCTHTRQASVGVGRRDHDGRHHRGVARVRSHKRGDVARATGREADAGRRRSS